MLSEAKHLWTSFDSIRMNGPEILRFAQDDKPVLFWQEGHKIAHWFASGD